MSIASVNATRRSRSGSVGGRQSKRRWLAGDSASGARTARVRSMPPAGSLSRCVAPSWTDTAKSAPAESHASASPPSANPVRSGRSSGATRTVPAATPPSRPGPAPCACSCSAAMSVPSTGAGRACRASSVTSRPAYTASAPPPPLSSRRRSPNQPASAILDQSAALGCGGSTSPGPRPSRQCPAMSAASLPHASRNARCSASSSTVIEASTMCPWSRDARLELPADELDQLTGRAEQQCARPCALEVQVRVAYTAPTDKPVQIVLTLTLHGHQPYLCNVRVTGMTRVACCGARPGRRAGSRRRPRSRRRACR